MLVEEKKKLSIGLFLQGESYLETARFCNVAEKEGRLRLRFNSPIAFLVSQGIELILKSWLQTKGFNPNQLRAPDLGHNLTKLYKNAKKNGLHFDEIALVNDWAELNPTLHLAATRVATEIERISQISSCRRGIEYWRHMWLLGKLHNRPFVLRYHKVGLYRYPDIDFLIFGSLKLCQFIKESPEMLLASRGN